jgi:hypothetical protein
MRLTVGPLPAAVYWRRRATVLVGLAMVVLVLSYACGGPGGRTANADPNTSGSTGPSKATTSATLLRPVVATATVGPTAFTLPTTGVTGPCTDPEMLVTAMAGSAHVQRLQLVDVTIKIKNTSARACSRDIGADVQELRLVQGTSIIWSSDDCNANTGHDPRSFAPGMQVAFTLKWNGKVSRTGTGTPTCSTAAPAPPPGVYQLIARLGQKLSNPFAIRVDG